MDEHTKGKTLIKDSTLIHKPGMVRKSEMMNGQSGQTPIEIIQWTQLG